MQNWILAVVLALVCSTSHGQLQEIKNFGDNPGNLKAFLFDPIPKGDTVDRPLLVLLHGCNQDATTILYESGWDKLAKEKGFYVLCPEQKLLNNTTRCFNWFLDSDNQKDKGELLSIKNMINYVFSYRKINPRQVYFHGLSAGAFMSVAYAANYPMDVRAAAISAGGPYVGSVSLRDLGQKHHFTTEEWRQKIQQINPEYHGPWPKLVILHGEKDKVVNIQYSYELSTQFSALQQIDYSSSLKDTVRYGKIELHREFYLKEKDTLISCIYMKDLGHVLPIDPGNGPLQGGKTGLFSVDKDWFSTRYVMQLLGL